jgi:8-oxo-dGTP pyrophosphatase MutT (NUDIX family)
VFEFPAGTISEGEEPEAAAHRELEEETGYTMGPGELPTRTRPRTTNRPQSAL